MRKEYQLINANHYSLCIQANLCDLPKEKKGEGKCVKKLGHLDLSGLLGKCFLLCGPISFNL